MHGNLTHGDVVLSHLWYVTAERYEPDLVCQVLHTQVDGNNDVVNAHWQDIEGLITLITEEQRRVDPSGIAIGVVDTRTRLVVRRYDDPEGNGSPVGFEPLVVDPTGEGIGGIGDYRTIRFVRRVDADTDRHDAQEARRVKRAADIRHDAAKILLEMFAAEQLERTMLENQYVRTVHAHDRYISWCNERHVRPAHRFEYHEFVAALNDLDWPSLSDAPRVFDGRHEYVIEHARLLPQ